MVDEHEPGTAWPLSLSPGAGSGEGHGDATRDGSGGSYWAGGISVRGPQTSRNNNSSTISDSAENTHKYHHNNDTEEGTSVRQSVALAPAWGGDGGERRGQFAAAAAATAARAAPRGRRQSPQSLPSARLMAGIEAARETSPAERESGTGGRGREDSSFSVARRRQASRVGGDRDGGDVDDGHARESGSGGGGRLRGLTSKASLERYFHLFSPEFVGAVELNTNEEFKAAIPRFSTIEYSG